MLPLQIISSGLRSERIVAKRSQNNVVIGRGSTIDACEHFAFDVFVLGADGHAAVIALVDVLPKAHRHVRQAPVVRDTVGGRAAGKRERRRDCTTGVAKSRDSKAEQSGAGVEEVRVYLLQARGGGRRI